jgi:hypothetical protein
MRGTAWLRSGSSLVWDAQLLGPLLENGELLPLHKALNWIEEKLPSTPPSKDGKTIFIVGLQTVLEVLSPEAAFKFLRDRVQRLIVRVQDFYGNNVGLVFGCNCNWRQWRIDSNEHAYLHLRSGHELNVTFALWNGVAREAQIIMVKDHKTQRGELIKETGGGFYVRRYS